MHRIINRILPYLALLAAICALSFFPLRNLRASRPALTWTAINVNSYDMQGDAHLIQIREQADFLIDTGHPVYAEDLFEFLIARRVEHLDFVVITHAHRDHYGGLAHLLRKGISVGKVYFNEPASALIEQEYWGCAMPDIEEIRRECALRHIPIIEMTDATEWRFGPDITLRVLYIHDGVSQPIGPTDINDTSAIMMLTHKRLKILFAGDVNRRLGRHITERAEVVPIKADILKAPHHGAEDMPDDEFFSAVDAREIIVPAPAKLWRSERCNRLRNLAQDASVYVNGLHGHIVVKSDGWRYTIETSAPAAPLPLL